MKSRVWLWSIAICLFATLAITSQLIGQTNPQYQNNHVQLYPLPAPPAGVVPGTQLPAASALEQSDGPQDHYRFVKIDPQGEGKPYVDAHDINNARQVVVNWCDTADCYIEHAALWEKGNWTSLDYVDPNCPDVETYLTSLSNRGIAFGTYYIWCTNYEPAAGIFLKRGDWFRLPDRSDFAWSQGLSMSEDGLAVGFAQGTDNLAKHWIWDGRRYLLPTFPANWDVSAFWSGPLSINNGGQIAGQYVDTASNRMRGYFQDGRRVITFDAPDNPSATFVNKITDAGTVEVTATYDLGNQYYPTHAFTWRHGVFTQLPNLPFPEAVATYVHGLNENGDFCGIWIDSTGLFHAFVAFRK